jgi:hypothetical protein
VVPHSSFPTPSTSSAITTPENTEEDPDDTEPAEEGDTHTEYCSDQLHSANIRATIKNDLHKHTSVYGNLTFAQTCASQINGIRLSINNFQDKRFTLQGIK